MLSRSRRGIVALLVGGLALVLTGCGTGFGAQTNQIYTAGTGSNHRAGDVEILNGLFVDNGDDTATFSGGLLDKVSGGDKVASVTVTTEDGKSITSELASPIELTDGELFTAGTEPEIVIRGNNFAPGDFVKVAFTFENAAPITFQVPVVTRVDMYNGVATAPPPTK